MSILGTIMSKVLGNAPAAPAAAATAAPSAQASGPTNVAPSAPAPTSSSAPPGPAVDVAAVLDALSDKKLRSSIGDTPKLDWRHSIVDLMKLLSVDSSLLARKELAKELHYDGDTNNSAAMDMWLHEHIMVILAANGGKLPSNLRRKWYLSHYGP
jgi:3-oxoacyl-ACP reductase-like protein